MLPKKREGKIQYKDVNTFLTRNNANEKAINTYF